MSILKQVLAKGRRSSPLPTHARVKGQGPCRPCSCPKPPHGTRLDPEQNLRSRARSDSDRLVTYCQNLQTPTAVLSFLGPPPATRHFYTMTCNRRLHVISTLSLLTTH